jgi:hypothetical protein
MRDRWLVVAVLATLIAVAGAAAHADSRPQKFELEANVPGVAATASILGSSLGISVQGVSAGAHLEAAVARLACARSFVERAAGETTADGTGEARWTANGLLTDALRDGRHVLAVWSGPRMVACAAIPSSAEQSPTRPWGLRSFTRRFVD